MAQIIGAVSVEDYHRNSPPWSDRKRAKPARTWSGNVVYKKKTKHFWTMKDLERISQKLEIEPKPGDRGWFDELIRFFQRVTIRMLEKILSFLDEETVTQIYYLIYEMLGKLFNVNTSAYVPKGNKEALMISIIERVATQAGVSVIVRKP